MSATSWPRIIKMSFKDIWDLRQPGRRDSSRHRERIKKAIKENLKDLISEESIISSKGNKKIKVPVKYLDLWKFKYGKNNGQKHVGHGDGDPGDIIAKDPKKGKGQGEPGDKEGEEVYEEEVDLEEVIEMMLEDLDLPFLEEKPNQVEIETEETVFQDVSEKGLPANIDRRRTILQNLKRNAASGKAYIGNFNNDDLRYRVWENVIEKHSNAAVILIMDRSYSMSSERRYIVKSFFFWMVNFLRRKYNNTKLVFIAHDVVAREVPEEGFFQMADGGGTKISSGLTLAKEIIDTRFPPQTWNNYVFSFSDGENFGSDNDKCKLLFRELLQVCRSVGYGEVHYSENQFDWGTSWSTLIEDLKEDDELMDEKRFTTAKIEKREDVYSCLKDFLDIEGNK